MMKRMQKLAVLLCLIDKMKENGSWCGETHIQKEVHHLQEAENSDLGFDYILYKHGPFSFDLRDELTAMRADGLLELKMNPMPYGPSLAVTDYGREIMERFPITLGKYRAAIENTTEFMGDKGVVELEKLSTALYVAKNESQDLSVEERAQEINEIKPHISIDEAKRAIQEIDELLKNKNLN